MLISGFSKICFSQDTDFYNLYFEGNALTIKGQYDKAIEKYNQAIKLFSAPYVYYNRANAYLGKKDYTNALADYDKTILMNKDYAEAYHQRGMIKYAMGDNTCCDDIKKAVKLDLNDEELVFKKLCK